MHVDRERLMRDLTFWLRPDFVLRCLRRFQTLAGFDRSIALASLSFSALIPLGIISSSAISDGGSTGDYLVARFELEGKGATAVSDLFNTGTDLRSGLSIFSAFLLLVSILSLARAAQRLFERTWGLTPLSVRNTKNGLAWIAGLVGYVTIVGFVRTRFDSGVGEIVTALALVPAGAAFVLWSGLVLTGRRVTSRQLLPGAVLVAGLGVLYGIGSDIYVPRLFNSYASRYGAIGAVFALISWLFGFMVMLVGSTACGREVWAELEAIRRGDRPSNAQIQAEWAAVREQVEQGRTRVAEQARAVRARMRSRRPRGER